MAGLMTGYEILLGDYYRIIIIFIIIIIIIAIIIFMISREENLIKHSALQLNPWHETICVWFLRTKGKSNQGGCLMGRLRVLREARREVYRDTASLD